MPDYKNMYFVLFNAITDALTAMGQSNFGTASEILTHAQQKTEKSYIAAEKTAPGED